MGYFFAASAFKSIQPEALAYEIIKYLEKYSLGAHAQKADSVNESTDVLLYTPVNQWTVVMWPQYFNIHDVPLCAAVSGATGTVAVTVNVYDGSFWSHELLAKGVLIDQCAPCADYFAEDSASAEQAKVLWRGNAESWASTLTVGTDLVLPYFRYLKPEEQAGKAFVDDEFPLDDFWVFTDMWRRIGISYPAHPSSFVLRLSLATQFGNKLPSWEGKPLPA